MGDPDEEQNKGSVDK